MGPEARVGGRERATSGGFTVSAPHAEINHAAYVACVCIYLCSCVYRGGGGRVGLWGGGVRCVGGPGCKLTLIHI